MKIAKCRSCGADIVWATNERSGKPAPIDAEPDPRGNIELWDMPDGTTAYSMPHQSGWPRYVNHFATCPYARQHASKRYSKRAHTPR